MKPSIDFLEAEPEGLSAEDVEALLTREDASPRLGVMEKVAAKYNSRQFGPRESAIAEQIFRVLVQDAELEVRMALAERIKENPWIPRDVVLHMVQDVEAVALPVLRSTEVLSEPDMVALIEAGMGMNYLSAIAQRETVSEVISAALVDKGDAGVVTELVGNPGANLHEETFDTILARYEHDETVISTVSARENLPITVVEMLVTSLSDSLAEELKRKYRLDPNAIEPTTEQAREQATLKLLASNRSRDKVERLVQQLHAGGRLSPSILITALCHGNLYFFELALARLARVPAVNARALLKDKGELGFQALYAKAGMPDMLLPAMKLVLNVVREAEHEGETPGTSAYGEHIASRLLYFSEGKHIEGLGHVLALVRQG